MDYPCKPCGGTIAPSELVLPVPLDPVHIVAVDLGKVYTCSDCGKTFVVWSQRNLAFKTSMAAFLSGSASCCWVQVCLQSP